MSGAGSSRRTRPVMWGGATHVASSYDNASVECEILSSDTLEFMVDRYGRCGILGSGRLDLLPADPGLLIGVDFGPPAPAEVKVEALVTAEYGERVVDEGGVSVGAGKELIGVLFPPGLDSVAFSRYFFWASANFLGRSNALIVSRVEISFNFGVRGNIRSTAGRETLDVGGLGIASCGSLGFCLLSLSLS